MSESDFRARFFASSKKYVVCSVSTEIQRPEWGLDHIPSSQTQCGIISMHTESTQFLEVRSYPEKRQPHNLTAGRWCDWTVASETLATSWMDQHCMNDADLVCWQANSAEVARGDVTLHNISCNRHTLIRQSEIRADLPPDLPPSLPTSPKRWLQHIPGLCPDKEDLVLRSTSTFGYEGAHSISLIEG